MSNVASLQDDFLVLILVIVVIFVGVSSGVDTCGGPQMSTILFISLKTKDKQKFPNNFTIPKDDLKDYSYHQVSQQ